MKTVLDAGALTLSTPYGIWSIAAKHNRPGGDVDVVLARGASFLAFRRSEGEWTQLAGSWRGLNTAITRGARTTRRQVFTAQYLVPLLDIALMLEDFPPPEPEWLTVAEAAELVGRSVDSIRYRIKNDLVEYRQDGRRWQVTKASVLEAFPPVRGAA